MKLRRNFLALAFTAPAFAQIDKIVGGLLKPTGNGPAVGLPDAQIASGLKEALSIGAENAVKLTGVEDGFFRNEPIKILLPPKIQQLEKALRVAGMGPQVDAFVLGMNRAAEKAVPEATRYFKEAILNMTMADARGILTGGDTAATDYFRTKTSTQLTAAFTPPVETAMNQVGVVQQFNGLMSSAKRLPFVRADNVDIKSYVVEKTLGGLFHIVGQEERKIRREPSAQVTPLLKQVFGAAK